MTFIMENFLALKEKIYSTIEEYNAATSISQKRDIALSMAHLFDRHWETLEKIIPDFPQLTKKLNEAYHSGSSMTALFEQLKEQLKTVS